MKYQTQKVAMLYFYGALTLFLAQVLFGLLAGTIYVLPNTCLLYTSDAADE